MTERQAFSAQLQLLQQAEQQDLSNLFILHGIVHLYQGVFDLAIDGLSRCLKARWLRYGCYGFAKGNYCRSL